MQRVKTKKPDRFGVLLVICQRDKLFSLLLESADHFLPILFGSPLAGKKRQDRSGPAAEWNH